MKRYLIIDGGTANLRVTLADETAQILGMEKRSAVRECIQSLPSAHHVSSANLSGCMTTISGELLAALTYYPILTEAVGG